MALSFVLASAAGGASAANPISPHLWTFLLQALNILVVLGVLYKFLFRPLGAIMAKREAYVEDSLSHAARTRTEAEKLLAEYQEQLRAARQETEQLMEKAAKEAQEYANQRKAEADKQYEKMMARAKGDIELERQKALASIRDEMASLAVLAAGKVLGRTIDEKDHRELIDDFVQKVGESR